MNFYAISALINVATSLVLGLLILFTNPKDRTNVTFFLFSISTAFWSFFYFLWQISDDAGSALLWSHWLMAGAIFITFFYFHFIARFLQIEKSLKWVIVLGYFGAAFFSLINWSPFFIKEIATVPGFALWPIAGPLFGPFLAVWIFYAALPVYFLIRKLPQATKVEQSQIKYILAGTIVGYLGGCTNYFLWYGIDIPPYGNISASFYIILVAYAILKYRLFNMKVVATEFIVFALWLFVFIRMLLAESVQEGVVNGVLLAVLLGTGVMLIRSVDREVGQREKIEKLALQLSGANARLKELDQMKSEFLSIASHQLRAPITAVRGYVSLILDGDYGAAPDKFKEPLQRIADSSRNMANSIEDYLNVSRIEQGRMKYEKSSFDLTDLAKKTLEELRPVAERRGLALTLAAGEALKVTADVGKIKQVISNLVDNAIKYTEKGSITVEVKQVGGRVRLVVSDTGIGIAREEVEHLFEKFKRARDANKVNTTGTGLGLYVAKQLIEGHGGRVWVESDGPGKGSRFIFELPV